MDNPIIIRFSKLHSFKDIKNLKKNINAPGIYIWGLVFPKKNSQPIGNPIDNTETFDKNKHIFIPYYVGQSEKSVLSCFNGRHNYSNKNNRYLILSYKYIKEFYKDPNFEEMLDTGPNRERAWVTSKKDYFKGKIIYYNNYYVIKHIYDLKHGQLAAG